MHEVWNVVKFILATFWIQFLIGVSLTRLRMEIVKGAQDFLTFYLERRKELIAELEKRLVDELNSKAITARRTNAN